MDCGYQYTFGQLLSVAKDYKTLADSVSDVYPIDLIKKRKPRILLITSSQLPRAFPSIYPQIFAYCLNTVVIPSSNIKKQFQVLTDLSSATWNVS